MGTWGSGIYDNDGALDGLASLVRIPEDEQDAARLVASIGLVAWLRPVALVADPGAVHAVLARVTPGLADLPQPTREALTTLLADPELARGARIDPLLRFPGAAAVITELAQRAALRLDDALGGDEDLYEIAGDLGALGVLLELHDADLWHPGPQRRALWQAGFDAADRVTDEERDFWDAYVAHVRAGLERLATPAR